MKTINRMMTNICSDDPDKSRDFYTKLSDFHVNYDSDWFIHLISKDKKPEPGIIDRTWASLTGQMILYLKIFKIIYRDFT